MQSLRDGNDVDLAESIPLFSAVTTRNRYARVVALLICFLLASVAITCLNFEASATAACPFPVARSHAISLSGAMSLR